MIVASSARHCSVSAANLALALSLASLHLPTSAPCSCRALCACASLSSCSLRASSLRSLCLCASSIGFRIPSIACSCALIWIDCWLGRAPDSSPGSLAFASARRRAHARSTSSDSFLRDIVSAISL
eukprot:CAMPEP_0172090894 /NCGR_PEP_ID=MMETSP1043-20130122/24616_1 /TAXON_ID=464988 /ORGANISM="Hemiselmis andersenii, Strain CCMP441" /LENGTH=125 /DNA_ID=CAMNT_0012753507 /DNA_START=57 /DNA_END=431 /DNA_ORIENTATION=-